MATFHQVSFHQVRFGLPMAVVFALEAAAMQMTPFTERASKGYIVREYERLSSQTTETP